MADFEFVNEELEFVDDYFEDVDDEFLGYSDSSMSNRSSDGDDKDPFDSDVDDDFDCCEGRGKSKTDTTAKEAKNGKDIQGIPWERLNFTRDRYRETRLKQYKNFQSVPSSSCLDELRQDCKQVEKGHSFYDFQFNTRLVKSTIVHFQINEGLTITNLP